MANPGAIEPAPDSTRFPRLISRGLRYWILVVAAVPIVASLPALRRGAFTSSAEWAGAWPQVLLLAAAAGAALIALDFAIAKAREQRSAGQTATMRGTGRVYYLGLCVALPVWAWATTDMVIRPWLHEHDFVATVSAPATMISYNTFGKTGDYVIVASDEFGRVRLAWSELNEKSTPAPGTSVTMVGHRSWVGTSYDSLAEPE